MSLVVSLGPELERIEHFIAVGLQVVDALTLRPLLVPLRVRLLAIGPLKADLDLQSKGGGRYSLVDAGAFARLWNRTTEPGRLLPRSLDLLLSEASSDEASAPHRASPRRLSLALVETAAPRPRPAPNRANAPTVRLWPGAAYAFDGGATLIRGRVSRNSAGQPPARWARIVATRAGRVLGMAQADERGEYALALRYPAGLLAPTSPSASDGDVRLDVFARSAPPAHAKPFDDLSAEPAAIAAADADPVTNRPAAYDLQANASPTLVFGRTHSGPTFDFLL
ncbi:MAG TPA: hypothetical protein VIN03_09725 [Roseateles sp.]